MTSMTNIQNNCLPHQNGVEDTQQVDLDPPHRQIPERETRPDYNRNTSSLQNNVITYNVSMTDINLDHQDDYARNAYPQQQVGLDNLPQPERDQNTSNTNSINENIGNNNALTTQAISVVDINQNYDDNGNDSQDVNINLSKATN